MHRVGSLDTPAGRMGKIYISVYVSRCLWCVCMCVCVFVCVKKLKTRITFRAHPVGILFEEISLFRNVVGIYRTGRSSFLPA